MTQTKPPSMSQKRTPRAAASSFAVTDAPLMVSAMMPMQASSPTVKKVTKASGDMPVRYALR